MGRRLHRHDHRWVRLGALALMIGLPVAAACTGAARLVPFLALPLVVLGGPVLLRLVVRGDGRSEEGGASDADSDSDDGPGGNCRPDRGPSTPSGPRGGLPLPVSAPGSWRLRGTVTQPRQGAGSARRQPHRAPVRSPRRTPVRGSRA